MTYQISTFAGDEIHAIDTTGDCVVGDVVAFERANFTGSYPKSKFAGFELVFAEIIADSYGSEKQQHTFTLKLADGSTSRIMGRNLYKNRVYRAAWTDEAARRGAADEKHARGDIARADRAMRKGF